MRQVISTAPLSAAALGELKQWLAITTTGDDAALADVLETALAMCEAFIGQRPIEARMAESVRADGSWQPLATRPVSVIDDVGTVPTDGSASTPLAAGQYEVDIDFDRVGRVRARASGHSAVQVTFTAGMAADWEGLPAPIRHGAIRLAAALFRTRGEDAPATPPAAVAALLRPYRRLALA